MAGRVLVELQVYRDGVADQAGAGSLAHKEIKVA